VDWLQSSAGHTRLSSNPSMIAAMALALVSYANKVSQDSETVVLCARLAKAMDSCVVQGGRRRGGGEGVGWLCPRIFP